MSDNNKTNDKAVIETDAKENKIFTSSERNLELYAMSKKERKAAKKQQLKETLSDMTAKEKLSYLFTYYKWYVLIPLISIILIIYIGTTVYRNSRPVALSYAILNVADTKVVDTSFCEDYAVFKDFPDDYRFVGVTEYNVEYQYYLEHMEYIQTSNSTDYNILSTRSELGDFDIIITNKAGMEYCSAEYIAKAMQGYLDANQYEKLKPYMVDSPNHHGTPQPYAIDVSNTEFAKNLNAGYSDVYIMFPGVNKTNKKNALMFLEYVLDIKILE